jgi:stalled ribosome rescue protein Dom34
MSDIRRFASIHFQEACDYGDSMYSFEFGEYKYTDEQKKVFEKTYSRFENLLNEIGQVCELVSKEPHFVGYSGDQYIWPKVIEMNTFMFTFVSKGRNKRIIEIVKRSKAYQNGFILIYE